jgi:hypothetical protein
MLYPVHRIPSLLLLLQMHGALGKGLAVWQCCVPATLTFLRIFAFCCTSTL